MYPPPVEKEVAGQLHLRSVSIKPRRACFNFGHFSVFKTTIIESRMAQLILGTYYKVISFMRNKIVQETMEMRVDPLEEESDITIVW